MRIRSGFCNFMIIKKMLSHKKKTNKQNKAVNDSTKNFVWDQRKTAFTDIM